MVIRNPVVAVFYKGEFFLNFDGAGQSHFSLMGIGHVCQIVFNL